MAKMISNHLHFKEFTDNISGTSINQLIESWENVIGKISDKNDFIKTASILSKDEMIKANYSLLVHGKTCSNYKFFLLSNIENYSFNGNMFKPKTYENEFINDGIKMGKPIYYNWCKDHKFLNPPCKTGIYYLFNEGVLVYIGFSKNIRNRLKSHFRDNYKPFDAVLWNTKNGLSLYQWLKIERNEIIKWSPCLNINYVG